MALPFEIGQSLPILQLQMGWGRGDPSINIDYRLLFGVFNVELPCNGSEQTRDCTAW